jgi:hypothetical protein
MGVYGTRVGVVSLLLAGAVASSAAGARQAGHNACGDLTQAQVASAIGLPIKTKAGGGAAIDGAWQHAPIWASCVWSSYGSTPTTLGVLQLDIDVLPSPAQANAYLSSATTQENGGRPFHPTGGVGTRAVYLVATSVTSSVELGAVHGDVVVGIQGSAQKARTPTGWLAVLKPLARWLLQHPHA